MTQQEQIIALELELIDTRRAAVRLVLEIANSVDRTAQGREEIARSFDLVSAGADLVSARLARLVAEALRRG